MLKHFGLPLILLRIVFFIVVFELLRRLFRNVGRERASPSDAEARAGPGRLALVYSIVSAISEAWFVHAMYSYLVQNAQIAIQDRRCTCRIA